MLKNRTWIIIISIILAISGAFSYMIYSHKSKAHIVEIRVNNEVIKTIDLDTVTKEYSFTIKCDEGYNTVIVQPGRIRISDADCKDHICVETGWLSDQSQPIVCMPHHLMITLVESETDGTV